MCIKNWKKELLTIPNILSLFRLILIPIYVFIYLNATESMDYFIAAAILAISCLTDLIDGKIARRFNMISTLGKVLDPLADKATQLTLIVCLAVKHTFLRYLVALFVIKESFQAIAGVINFIRGRMLKGALLTGKICTTVLFVSLILLVMMPALSEGIIRTIVIIDIIFMSISFLDYLITYFLREDRFQPLNNAPCE